MSKREEKRQRRQEKRERKQAKKEAKQEHQRRLKLIKEREKAAKARRKHDEKLARIRASKRRTEVTIPEFGDFPMPADMPYNNVYTQDDWEGEDKQLPKWALPAALVGAGALWFFKRKKRRR